MQPAPNCMFLQQEYTQVPKITAGKLAGSESMRKLCRAVLIPSHKPSEFMATGHLSQRLFASIRESTERWCHACDVLILLGH